MRNRQQRIDGGELALNGRCERQRIPRCLHDPRYRHQAGAEPYQCIRQLRGGHVHRRRRGLIEAVLAHVADDCDDLTRRIFELRSEAAADRDLLTDGILIWPAIARQRFADHGNVRRIRAVALVEDSTTNEGDSENLEVSVRDDAEVRAAEAFFLLAQRTKTIRGFGHLVLGHQ